MLAIPYMTFALLSTTAEGAGNVAGKVVDIQGFPLRGAIISSESGTDTADYNGIFGPGRAPIIVSARGKNPPGICVSGHTLQLTGENTGPVRATLLRHSGRVAAPTLETLPGKTTTLDLNAFATDPGERGLYILKIEYRSGGQTGGLVRYLPIARIGRDNWAASPHAAVQPSQSPSGRAKASAAAATVTITKPGYLSMTATVNKGAVGTVILQADFTANKVEAPFDLLSFYTTSGWVGDTEIDKSALAANTGEPSQRLGDADGKCTKWVYKNAVTTDSNIYPKGWQAVVYQYPANNWGAKAGRAVLGGHRITFWAKGEKGGENLEFKAGNSSHGSAPDPGPYQDSFYATTFATLKKDWHQYEVPLDQGADLSSVLSGFIWAAISPDKGATTTFYLDEIRFE